MNNKIIKAIIPAGGSSVRYGGNKLLEILNGKEVIMHSIDTISNIESIQEIIIPASESLMPILKELTKNNKKIKIVKGGSCRQESVYKGLQACGECDIVAIHDGARPLIKQDTFEKALTETLTKHAIIVGVRTVDTIKIVDTNLKIIETPNRDRLWNVQTPQIFDYDLIFNAHTRLKGQTFSDDGGLLEYLGENVYMFEGDYTNFKITTPNDLIQAEKILECNK